jgi:transposase
MPMERLAMRHVRDVIRLKSSGMPTREIAGRVGAASSKGRLTLRRFEASGMSWPLPEHITDSELEARLFAGKGAGPGTRRGHRRQTEPDWAAVHRELKRKHVTLAILWEEYIASEPGRYRYSQFCELHRAWEGKLSVTMRQSHAAGDGLTQRDLKPIVQSLIQRTAELETDMEPRHLGARLDDQS